MSLIPTNLSISLFNVFCDIINIMTMSIPESFGNTPAIVKWTVVRGDTARLRVDFLENDETS